MPKRMDDRCEVYYLDEEKVKQAQSNLVDGLTATHMAQIYRALSDPSRVRIVSTLVAGELCVCDIAASVGMSQSAVSHQLRALRDAHLVKFRKVGRKAYYALESGHIASLFAESLKHTGVQ